jgi:signal transduction histidine kinase
MFHVEHWRLSFIDRCRILPPMFHVEPQSWGASQEAERRDTEFDRDERPVTRNPLAHVDRHGGIVDIDSDNSTSPDRPRLPARSSTDLIDRCLSIQARMPGVSLVTQLITTNALADRLRDSQTRLEELHAQLEHCHRLATLGTLAAGIAHEINNILTPVLAYAQLASQNPRDEALGRKALEKAIQGVETATQITQAMLGFASNPSQCESANVLSVVQSALECIGRHPSKDRIQVNIKVEPDLFVRIRPLALQQVLVNLILNACNAMRGRGGELAITATIQKTGMVQLRVIDNGPGIPADIAGRLFEPFVSTHKQSNPLPVNRSSGTRSGADHRGGFVAPKSGTGLGLAISRQLIEAAEGSIIASSKPGEGAAFVITLPGEIRTRAKAS